MTVDLNHILTTEIAPGHQMVTAKDAILYAISVGHGGRSAVPDDLGALYERVLEPVATFANVVARGSGPWMEEIGIDFIQVVHAEHRLTLHRAMPIDAMIERRTRISAIVDRGAGKGMFLSSAQSLHGGPDEGPIATIVHTDACRGDGGCGSIGTPPEPLVKPPERQPDLALDLPVRHDAGILYRLNGDLNPLHIDPVVARAASFPGPILHGLCTFGHAGYAIGELMPMAAGTTLTAIAARFTAPFYAGETLRTEVWREGDGMQLQFRCRSVERNVIVLDAGAATLGAFG
jgi:acyl dehydratase